MNKVILMGRLTRDPDVRYSAGESGTSVARYTLAVDRRFNKRDGEATADFISCVAFGQQCRVCGEVFPSGTEGSRYRSYPDRKLYQQRWQQGLHYRCSSRGSGVC